MTLVNQTSARADQSEKLAEERKAKRENARKDFDRTVEENKRYREEIGQADPQTGLRVTTARQRGETQGTFPTVEDSGSAKAAVKKGQTEPSERSGQKD